MKKFVAFILAFLFIAGCSGIQFNDDESRDFLYRIAGHRLGYELAKKDPATAKVAVIAADGVMKSIEAGTTDPELSALLISALLQDGVAKLAVAYKDDPALAAEISMVSELIVFKGATMDTEATKKYIEQMKAGLDGFKLGISIAQKVAAEKTK